MLRLASAISGNMITGRLLKTFRFPFRKQLDRHLQIWTFLIGVTICGLIFGGVVAGQLAETDKLVLGNALQQLFGAVKQHQLATGSQLWSMRLVSDVEVLGLLWIFGASMIGVPLVIAIIFIRTFCVGFAVGYTTLQFGWKGFLFSCIAIFLHQIVTLTTLLIAGVLAIRFSLQIVERRQPMSRFVIRFFQYTGTFLLCGGGLMVGAFIQAFLVPHLLIHLFA